MGYLAIATAWLSAVILIDTHVRQADQQAGWFFGINLAWALIGPIATVVLAVAVASDWTAACLGHHHRSRRDRGMVTRIPAPTWRPRGRVGSGIGEGTAAIRCPAAPPHPRPVGRSAFLDRFIVAGAAGMAGAGLYTVVVSVALGIGAMHDGCPGFFAPRLARWSDDESGDGLRKGSEVLLPLRRRCGPDDPVRDRGGQMDGRVVPPRRVRPGRGLPALAGRHAGAHRHLTDVHRLPVRRGPDGDPVDRDRRQRSRRTRPRDRRRGRVRRDRGRLRLPRDGGRPGALAYIAARRTGLLPRPSLDLVTPHR